MDCNEVDAAGSYVQDTEKREQRGSLLQVVRETLFGAVAFEGVTLRPR